MTRSVPTARVRLQVGDVETVADGRFEIRLLLQRHPRACAATAAAMTAAVDLATAEHVNGVYATRTNKLVESLRTLGVLMFVDRLVRINRYLAPRPGDIVKVRWKSGSHWTVKVHDGYFDPLYGHVDDAFYQRKNGRPSSFLPVRWNPFEPPFKTSGSAHDY